MRNNTSKKSKPESYDWLQKPIAIVVAATILFWFVLRHLPGDGLFTAAVSVGIASLAYAYVSTKQPQRPQRN